jgi:hypothetical protein
MKYAIEMGSVAMIYITSSVKFGSGIRKLVKEDIQTHRQTEDFISRLRKVYQCNIFSSNVYRTVSQLSLLPSIDQCKRSKINFPNFENIRVCHWSKNIFVKVKPDFYAYT